MWEYNTYIIGYSERQKQETAASIMTGYYTAYYTNGGKKAKRPDELIKKLFAPDKKQSLDEGLAAIENLKKAERNSDKRRQ